MAWASEQCVRLAIEKKAVERHFPGAQFVNPKADTYVLLDGRTKSDMPYELKTCIPNDYPDSPPHLYVIDPNPLMTHDNSTINCLGSSHAFHTYVNGPDGCVHVCHTDHWHPGMTITGGIHRI